MPTFIPGLELAGLFYSEAVKPILDAEYPDLDYSAGLVGSGSEILGCDTAESTDHHWGPRLMLFLSEADQPRYAESIRETMRHKLPYQFRGYSTNYALHPTEANKGIMVPQPVEIGPVNHRVDTVTLEHVLQDLLGVDPHQKLSAVDWLTFPQQRLLELTAGRVYYDGLGTLEALRHKFAYYPHDLRLYLLAVQWRRISQEEPFMGRAGFVGDELGSQVVASRLVRDVMMLCFLMEKRYAPYTKWFGTAFSRLKCAPTLTPILQAALYSQGWQTREKYLSEAYAVVAEMHNALGITDPLPAQVSRFYGRPYLVIHGENFCEAIRERIVDEEIRRLPAYVGSIDQYVNSTDVLSSTAMFRRFISVSTDRPGM